jgi:hypothetical protein
MVFTKVQIFRGCIIPKSVLKRYYYEIVKPEQDEQNENDNKEEDDIENDNWWTNNDTNIYEQLYEEFRNTEYSDNRFNGKRFEIRFYGPCHGLKEIMIGIEIVSYERVQWNWEQCKEKLKGIEKEWKDTRERFEQFTKKVLSYEKLDSDRSSFCGKLDGNDRYCGEYTVCDECLGMTTNGFYNVCSIIDNITKCDFDYEKNKEKSKENKESNLLTSDVFIDHMIKNIIDSLDIGMNKNDIKIETYYCVDDCLSCS